MVTIKNRNDMALTKAEDIKKKWQEYTEELYKEIETINWERLEFSSRKLEIPREHFRQRWAQ